MCRINRCLELDNKYWEKDSKKWFEGYLALAEETNYALAECQVGFSYLEGIGTEKTKKMRNISIKMQLYRIMI